MFIDTNLKRYPDRTEDVFLYKNFFLVFATPKCLTKISTQRYTSQTLRKFILFAIVLGQHVSILTESSPGASKNTDPYLAMFKNIAK